MLKSQVVPFWSGGAVWYALMSRGFWNFFVVQFPYFCNLNFLIDDSFDVCGTVLWDSLYLITYCIWSSDWLLRDLRCIVHDLYLLIVYLYRFFLDIASDSPPSDSVNHSLSFISDGNVLALHRLLWNNQERIGQYLSSNRYVIMGLLRVDTKGWWGMNLVNQNLYTNG